MRGTRSTGTLGRQALSDRLALKPYWGKPTVRNFRGGDGDVGIIEARSAPSLYPTVLSVSAAVVLAACGGGGGMAEDVTPAAQAAVSQPAAVEPEIIPLEDVQASQSGSVSQTIATTQITITYDRPVARGRELFGGIVAFGEIWNPGANDATKVSVSQPVMINGMALPAGDYSIWAIPDPDEWTVIFSRAADVYHEPYPGEEHEELRLTVAPQTGQHIETLAFYFPAVEKKDAELRLHWGETIVPLQITVP